MAKSILVTNEGIVIGYSDNLLIIDENTVAISPNKRFAKSAYSEIIEMNEIPLDYQDYKYKYDKLNGFILNENSVEPQEIVDPNQLREENVALKQQVQELTEKQALMQQALDDLILGGTL
ncbi:hypothetical protein ACE38V_11505 [Cytobacillus sp. Hz8]|uniref:hypothetical protein n=1 Tax=Cytobacillus sp. Hz8 TaxID=3347168 RepID=UPI0035E15534